MKRDLLVNKDPIAEGERIANLLWKLIAPLNKKRSATRPGAGAIYVLLFSSLSKLGGKHDMTEDVALMYATASKTLRSLEQEDSKEQKAEENKINIDAAGKIAKGRKPERAATDLYKKGDEGPLPTDTIETQWEVVEVDEDWVFV